MKHYQDDEIEFRKKDTTTAALDYPDLRGLIVYSYGDTLEKSIAAARKTFGLGDEWEVIRSEAAG